MDISQLIKSLTPDVYANLKQAIELGRWPDGVKLSAEQKELCMEAILRYEIEHNVPNEQRVGYLGNECASGGKTDTNPSMITSTQLH